MRTMRDYQHIERYLNHLLADIYPQPSDRGHQVAIHQVCNEWLSKLDNINTILDVGCAQGQAIPELQKYGKVVGVTLGEDADVAKKKGYDIYRNDISFLPFEDESFDLLFARHTIEHSPMPLLTLMEWYRVSRQWLLLVVPSLEFFGPTGINHYYVLQDDQWTNLLKRSGWHPIWEDDSNELEHRFMCEKVRSNEWNF